MNIYLEKFIKEYFKSNGKSLDLGAGKFYDVVCLKQLGWDAEGVDKNMGIDLNKPYISANAPFDLVYSNYIFHFLENRQQLFDTAYDNLKDGGYFFLHAFHANDKIIKVGLTEKEVDKMAKKFKNIESHVIDFYDNEHQHWHKILEVIMQK